MAALAAGEHAGGHGGHEGGHDMGQMRQGGHEAGGMQHGGHNAHGAGGGMHDAAAGRPGDPAKVSRTIEVTMHDNMRFTPERIRVKAGETVRFFVRNEGNLPHEFVLGSMEELKEHAAMMRAQPDMKHADPNTVSLGPGKLGGLVWQFDQPGTVDFACLVPGHFEAGMTGTITVE
jgi:uncharacterized cupredoxin-like copper-binding protein